MRRMRREIFTVRKSEKRKGKHPSTGLTQRSCRPSFAYDLTRFLSPAAWSRDARQTRIPDERPREPQPARKFRGNAIKTRLGLRWWMIKEGGFRSYFLSTSFIRLVGGRQRFITTTKVFAHSWTLFPNTSCLLGIRTIWKFHQISRLLGTYKYIRGNETLNYEKKIQERRLLEHRSLEKLIKRTSSARNCFKFIKVHENIWNQNITFHSSNTHIGEASVNKVIITTQLI